MSNANSQTPEIFDLTIESLSYFGGRGVGRHDGLVVFVPGTAPGDRVRVRLTARKPRFLEAELVKILEPSSSRREPPCPVAGRCGGCSWQHIVYSEQVKQKEKILRDSLRKLEKSGAFEWKSFVPALEEFHYRNRIQVQVRGDRVGFFAKRTRDLVSIQKCFIAEEALNQKLGQLSADDRKQSRVELAIDQSEQVLVMGGERDPEAALFSQVNRAQNEKLKSLVTELMSENPDWMMDLYAGSGNLTRPMREKFPQVPLVAIELSKNAVARGREELAEVEWQAGDVAKVLSKTAVRSGFGTVVLDPPRTGADAEVIDQLLRHRPSRLIYVSCNPTTFARDAERLVHSTRYRLESVQGLDMFPQTEHVELVATLCAIR